MLINAIVLHYDEISLKGRNRPFFEKILRKNIIGLTANFGVAKVVRRYGKMVVLLDNDFKKEKITETLMKIPGIANFAFCVRIKRDFNVIKDTLLEFTKNAHFDTFRVHARRSDKTYQYNSGECNAILGEAILNVMPQKKVKLKNADITFYVEIGDVYAYIYTEISKGVGGLPVGIAGKMVCLISGGLDSPVAGFMMLKRGVKVIFIHFMNKTLNTKNVQNKIKQLTEKISQFQGKTNLYIIPFEDIQKEIIKKIDSKNRMIIYRRFMMRIASMVADKESALGLITGDCLSQVASQTLENLSVIHKASDKYVASPLIGMNKSEIMDIAKEIGTYDISVLPYQDCCSFLIDKHPETRSALPEIEEMESKMNISLLTQKAIDDCEMMEVRWAGR